MYFIFTSLEGLCCSKGNSPTNFRSKLNKFLFSSSSSKGVKSVFRQAPLRPKFDCKFPSMWLSNSNCKWPWKSWTNFKCKCASKSLSSASKWLSNSKTWCRVAKIHRMPYLDTSLFAKEPCNSWLLCGMRTRVKLTKGVIVLYSQLLRQC